MERSSICFILSWAGILFVSGSHAAQWTSSSPSDGFELFGCVGDTITFRWEYILANGQTIGNITWLYDGDTDEMIAILSNGIFDTAAPFSHRVQLVGNAGISLTNAQVGDSGNYSVEVQVLQDSNSHVIMRRAVVVRIHDRLMTKDEALHASQSSEAVLDPNTDRFAVQLNCGEFTLKHNPPFQVEWLTPSGQVLNSTDFQDHHFRLLLHSPVQGGNFTCRISPHSPGEDCLHGNAGHQGEATVYVDKMEARLSLLEKENEVLKAQLQQSNDQMNQVNGTLNRVKSTVPGRLMLMTKDGTLHASQSPEVVLDPNTGRFAVQLTCGEFTFSQDPPFQVEWQTPSGQVLNSTDFQDHHFRLLLHSPVQGGNFICRIPPHSAEEDCLHGNAGHQGDASVYVDKVEARLSILEKENELLKAQQQQYQKQQEQRHTDSFSEMRKLMAFVNVFVSLGDPKKLQNMRAANCHDGWLSFNNECYIYINEDYTWFDAKATCETLHGKLVEIETADENTFISNTIGAHGVTEAWIGLEDIAVEGHFVWATTDEAPEYTNWHPLEPSNSEGKEDCCIIFGPTDNSMLWGDRNCEVHHRSFVCEAQQHGGSVIG